MPDGPSSEIVVRQARASDRDDILEFIQPYISQKVLLPRTSEELEDLLDHGFVAEQDGRLIGFCALEVYSSKLAEVRSLAVAESARGAGLGRKLVESCLVRAKELKILEVMAISSSESFFRSCGFDFSLPGERKAFFHQTSE